MFEKKLVKVEDVFRFMSLALMFFMMCIGLLDVLGRYFFNSPISGVKELGVSVLPIITGLGLARTQYDGGHVGVELLYEKFPAKMRKGVDIFNIILSLAIWLLICYESLNTGNQFLASGRYVEIIHLPKAYLQYAVFVGCVLLCAQLGFELAKSFAKQEKGVGA
jgi:TRAP-type C4-dicarboxylate transport system permease small subunit